MAIMIPSDGPREHALASREGALYESLCQLSDDFYVVHSLDMLCVGSGSLTEREADFVVFHKDLGILCIEAKAGQARYENGAWRYASGRAMSHGGPYSQANGVKHHIMHGFEELGLADVEYRCKFLHAVWFVTLSRSAFSGVTLPPEASLDITLFAEDMVNPEPRIREIMSLGVGGIQTNLSSGDAQKIVRKVLCPEFSIVPTQRMRYDMADAVFARLLDSQARVLNYISDQRTAVINGAAGTGKTLIAMERAHRAAISGRVLFLCFNSMLMSHLRKLASETPSIDVWSIAGYACSVCRIEKPDYEALAMRLLEMQEEETFPYKHVIVDEGQDFGVADIVSSDVLNILKEIVSKNGGTFYLFYDKRQFVQGSTLPSFINDADCKLTLYVNCRNAEGIARCSMRSLGELGKTEVLEGARTSGPPHLFASEDRQAQAKYVEGEIASLRGRGLTDIVILTCKTMMTSAFKDHVIGEPGRELWRGTSVRFTTCRKFKGLEADAIILVDVEESIWAQKKYDFSPAPGLLFYTGASRAKHELRIVCDMGEAGCQQTLARLGVESKRKPISRLAKRLNAVNVSV